MGFWQRIGYNFANLARFSGRDDRPTFWTYVIPLYILLTVIGMVVIVIMLVNVFVEIFSHIGSMPPPPKDNPFAPSPVEGQMRRAMQPFMGMMIVIGLVSTLLHVILFGGSMVRRLHDTDRSGWWAIIPVPVYVLGSLLSYTAFSDAGVGISMLGGIVGLSQWVVLGLMIYLLVQPGTPGPNRFGPAPG